MTGCWEGDALGLFLGRQKRRAYDQDTSYKCIKIIEQTQNYYRKQELNQKKRNQFVIEWKQWFLLLQQQQRPEKRITFRSIEQTLWPGGDFVAQLGA